MIIDPSVASASPARTRQVDDRIVRNTASIGLGPADAPPTPICQRFHGVEELCLLRDVTKENVRRRQQARVGYSERPQHFP